MEQRIEKFENMLALESDVRIADLLAVMGATVDIRVRGRQTAQKAREALYAEVDSLTAEEGEAYGAYRMVR